MRGPPVMMAYVSRVLAARSKRGASDQAVGLLCSASIRIRPLARPSSPRSAPNPLLSFNRRRHPGANRRTWSAYKPPNRVFYSALVKKHELAASSSNRHRGAPRRAP